MRLFIIAGELSGDHYGGLLADQLQKTNQKVEIEGWGGPSMRKSGVKIHKSIEELAFMGIWEVVTHSNQIFKNFKDCKNQIHEFKPDAIILIDYPGFNLRIAKWAKSQQIKVFYFIAPKMWAWGRHRMKYLQNYVDHLIVVFPFEKDFFEKYGIQTHYFGHPLAEAIKKWKEKELSYNDEKPFIALLPGSRKQEINRHLPLFMELAEAMPDHRFKIGKADSCSMDVYDVLRYPINVELVEHDTYHLLANCEMAIVASGTVSLEAALLNAPQIVVYKVHPLTYRLARWLLKIKFISLVNILLGRKVVDEYIQHEANIFNLISNLENSLKADKGKINEEYSHIWSMLYQENCMASIRNFILK